MSQGRVGRCRLAIWCVLLLAPVLAGGAPVTADDAKKDIEAGLNAQIVAWNRGDLEGFMNGYWRSPELVYIGNNSVIRGWQQMFDRERQVYKSPGGKEMGQLALPSMEISILGTDTALVWGTYTVTTHAGATRGGLYTLIVRKLPEGWRVVHDRTSSEPQPAEVTH